ncbi:MAG: N-acetylmuramoyl-L-alanine amidase [Bacteroidales bacterium]|nr:N-acetylmuramoyl-L-alanine amidase [Bacteroidales bacterium]
MENKNYLLQLFIAGIFLLLSGTLLNAAEKPFVVVIDAGHGGKDPGAIGKVIKEKTINLAVALKLGALISANHSDTRVVYTRKNDVFVELDERAAIANRAKADLFISIHTNAARTRSARGTETYTLGLARSEENLEVAKRENSAILLEDNYQEKYEGFDPNSTESYIIFEFIHNKHLEQSIDLASGIQKEFCNTAKRTDRGVRQAGFLVLRKTSMPSVLVELGYISNTEEEKYLASANGQQTLANSIYKAFRSLKRSYDKRNGVSVSSESKTPTEEILINKGKNTVTENKKTGTDKTIYKIQILTSDKKLSSNDRRFKGHKNISFYNEKGLYKYTIGESSDFQEISRLRKKILPDFKDAFVIRFVNGEKQN